MIDTLSQGIAKAVADTQSPAENAAGFVSDYAAIMGFSHMHDSGTGGNPSLGNFPLFFHPGCPNDDFAQCKYPTWMRMTERVNGSAFARPGYFRINLTNSVQAEMTATDRAALYRFNFPGTPSVAVDDVEVPYSPLVVIDLVDLGNSRSNGGAAVDPSTMRVTGNGTYNPSFGMGNYHAYFCADFKGAALRKSGTFLGEKATEEPKWIDSVGSGFHIPSGSAGAWLQFEKPQGDSILARVGVSFISSAQACENAEREIPDFRFDKVEDAARERWARQLSVIEVDPTGVSDDFQTTFWSGLYRSLLSPQNYTGENQLWNSSEPYYDS